MLSYFFWHWPAGARDYERNLIAFHRALAANPPAGYLGSAICRLPGAPWLPEAGGYEDRYFLTDFAALGALNEAAISGSRRAPHDVVASQAAGGAGGVYQLRAGAGSGRFRPFRTWVAKPAGTSYSDLDEILRPLIRGGALAWQRQLTLGPTPEFCIETTAPLENSMADALALEACEVGVFRARTE